jgi:putative ubiquitin-RnfH superfamily antitoxin RatB of RatAB toxin-antitoxin module
MIKRHSLATVLQAIEKSGLLERFPEIGLQRQKVGIFGKITRLDTKPEEDNRVGIYRPITADPETVEKRDNR